MTRFSTALSTYIFLFSAGAFALPPCMDGDEEISQNNQQVLKWKKTTKNQFKARGFIRGEYVRNYSGNPAHAHFSVKIGEGARESIEVVYNVEFGELPKLSPGATVEACGDYITSNKATSQYPASPDGAIIHWVHINPKGSGHDDGFVAVDGVVTGQDTPFISPEAN